MTSIKTIALAFSGVLWLSGIAGKWLYSKGYSAAEAECQVLNAQAKAIIEKKAEVKRAELEKKLANQFALDIESRNERLRELEAKLRAGSDQKCPNHERDRALKVAVGLEDVAKRAIRHLEAERTR